MLVGCTKNIMSLTKDILFVSRVQDFIHICFCLTLPWQQNSYTQKMAEPGIPCAEVTGWQHVKKTEEHMVKNAEMKPRSGILNPAKSMAHDLKSSFHNYRKTFFLHGQVLLESTKTWPVWHAKLLLELAHLKGLCARNNPA